MAIDDFLLQLGQHLGLGPLQRDASGVCRLVFDSEYAVDMEPSRDGADIYLVATVGPLDPELGPSFLKEMLGANLVGNGTWGATLSIDVLANEVVLWRSLHLEGLAYERFQSCVEDFVAALEHWRRTLDDAATGGGAVPAIEAPAVGGEEGWRIFRA